MDDELRAVAFDHSGRPFRAEDMGEVRTHLQPGCVTQADKIVKIAKIIHHIEDDSRGNLPHP